MPAFFDPLRSPFSPDLFQRFVSARPEALPKKPKISHHHARILKDCIARTRKNIFRLERRARSLNANILTVCRCIEHKQPVLPPTLRLAGIFQSKAVPSSTSEATPRTWSPIPLLRSHSPPDKTKTRNLASLIERPINIPDDERVIASPTSMTPEDIALMGDRKADLQVQLNLLVLKQAELEIDVHKLEADLMFWGGIYKKVNIANNQKLKQRKRKSYYQTKKPQRPSLLQMDSSSSDSTFSEHTEGSYTDTSIRFKIPRKVQATSIFAWGPARSRRNSWSEGDDLSLTRCSCQTGSSLDVGSTSRVKQDLVRDDSAVDMSADV
ncbi:hypothetical protein V8E51_016252 [Hyaloscypha variabilis]